MAGKRGQSEAAAARRQQALELRILGGSYRQIGDKLGVSEKTAYYDVQRELARVEGISLKKAERLRYLELQRLDRMQLALADKARRGDERAIALQLRVMERRARMVGLDAPEKVHVQDDAAARVVSELQLARKALLERRPVG